MVSAPDFNLFVTAMYWSAVVILGLALSLAVVLLIVRLQSIARRRHIAALVIVWKRHFEGAIPNKPRRLRLADVFTVLSLWNEFRSVSATDVAAVARLEDVASVQQFDPSALTLLRHGDAGDRIVALTYVGHRRLSSALPMVADYTAELLPELALAAQRASVLIDRRNLKSFAFDIMRREDWRRSTVEQILCEAKIENNSRPLLIAAEDASDDQLLRLLPFFTLCDPVAARAALREQLSFRENPNVLAEALRALTPLVQQEDRVVIRGFLEHPEWFVRVAALMAIASVCTPEDRAVLTALLSDGRSWVRYRAAQALIACATDQEPVPDVPRALDGKAQEALSQVISERSVGDLRQFVSAETEGARRDERPGVERLEMDILRSEA